MPSGRTHDTITFLLAPPTFLAALLIAGSFALALAVTCAMLFGGLMFGPDLDIQSRQYTRWGVFRFIWWPYRAVFRHRSRWSHGILFGTFIRVLYFTGMMVLLASVSIYLYALLTGRAAPGFMEMARAWRELEGAAARAVGRHVVWATLIGLWWGAASHTLADVAWSMLRKGSEIF